MFDPSFAATQLSPMHVDALAVVTSLCAHVSFDEMKSELPVYLLAASQATCPRDDVDSFTASVLKFWRGQSPTRLRTWKKAAQIIFCMSPNSASCERVFALLKNMFGDNQERALADRVQASLMLHYNGRVAASRK